MDLSLGLHDADLVTRQARIFIIEDSVTKPSDSARWGESGLHLTLIEV
jgi:hypothetical protein